jgi:hypothetical protein
MGLSGRMQMNEKFVKKVTNSLALKILLAYFDKTLFITFLALLETFLISLNFREVSLYAKNRGR